MRFSRRQILALCGSLPFVQTLLARVDNTDAEALRNSPFAYISPVKSDKTLSRCQAEVWYVRFEDALFVCSDTVSWRIQAVLQGLDQARLWLGDVGEWEKSDQTYKSLPTFIATAEIASGDELWDKLMGLFGEKYPLEWLLWRRSFRNGLADGSRTMLRYTIM